MIIFYSWFIMYDIQKINTVQRGEFMKVSNRNLLLIASIVWLIAGYNVLSIGLKAYINYITIFNILLSLVVFTIFQHFVFSPLVNKHTQRIQAYKTPQYFFHFFDLKSFLIMAFMMSLGITLRVFNLAPDFFIAVFYTGLGASLFLAGLLFFKNYITLKCTL